MNCIKRIICFASFFAVWGECEGYDEPVASSKSWFEVVSMSGGYYDILNLGEDVLDAELLNDAYLHVGSLYDSTHCSHKILFSVGKKRDGESEIWILVNPLNMDSVDSELKKGNALALDNFRRIDFREQHDEFILHSYLPARKEDDLTNFVYISDVVDDKFTFAQNLFLLYRKGNDLSAFCAVGPADCFYLVGCLYHREGGLNFGYVPNLYEQHSLRECPAIVSSCESSNFGDMVYASQKAECLTGESLYRVNGQNAVRKASTIYIQQGKPKRMLKGKH